MGKRIIELVGVGVVVFMMLFGIVLVGVGDECCVNVE